MAKTKISEFSSTPASNTDIDGINIAEGCAPSGINDAIRDLMAQLKNWQSGTSGDSMVIGAAGTLTLSGSTANGIAYLNGSNVVTSGSALSFDGTSVTASQFLDTGFTLADNIDITKKGLFDLSGLTTATTRTYTLPDVTGTVALLTGTQTFGSATTFSTATGNLNFGTSLTTGVLTMGGTASTGNLVLGRSTATQTTSIQAGATASGSTKTINFGTGGLSGSTTAITIGSSVSGASSTTTLNGTVALANALPTTSGGTGLTSFTANGVVYASSTSALATGSALTFDGSNLGVGLTPAGSFRLEIGGADGTQFAMRSTGTTSARIRAYVNSAESGVIGFLNGGGQFFEVAGSEQMRLTSTGLGIGTSSPAYKLDVNGNAQIGNATAGTNRYLYINGVANKAGGIGFQESGTNKWLIGNGAASENGNFEIYDAVNGNNLIFNHSGNLGLGVTPSAWNVFTALQMNGGSLSSYSDGSTNNQMFVNANAYYNSGWKYKNNGYASQYEQITGQHQWFTAPSGTAGNAITFTQAMTLDASGNLLLGSTSSPATIWSGSRTFSYVKGSTAGNGGEVIVESNNGNQQASFFASAITAEFGLWSTKASALLFGTNNTERARIDSSGNFGVGQTPTTSINQTAGTTIASSGYMQIQRSAANPFALARFGSSSGTITDFYYNATSVGTISITASATAYNTSSDYRLKNIDGPLTGSGDFIDALKPKVGTWKADGSKFVGFLAHEVQEVSPQTVVGEKDAVDEDGKPVMQAMEYGSSEFIANIIAELQSLRKRIATLEAK